MREALREKTLKLMPVGKTVAPRGELWPTFSSTCFLRTWAGVLSNVSGSFVTSPRMSSPLSLPNRELLKKRPRAAFSEFGSVGSGLWSSYLGQFVVHQRFRFVAGCSAPSPYPVRHPIDRMG